MRYYAPPALPEERFWPKVRWEPAPPPSELIGSLIGDCAIWVASLDPRGYGEFRIGGRMGSTVVAHKWAYEHYVRQVAPGLNLDHLCRRRACVNFFHVEPVTPKENILRGDGLVAREARRTHCQHGHDLTNPSALIKTRRVERRCKLCNQVKNKTAYHRNIEQARTYNREKMRRLRKRK